MGFVQSLSRRSLQEALPDGKTQQQAARQLESLGPLISDQAPLRDYTLAVLQSKHTDTTNSSRTLLSETATYSLVSGL
ncbi:hypothetical protein EYF80_055446 [Liparis tanakae]|uniref:Uncharacterized protein n=1 Tax=Liparis tanakae TaxID=230148 RepID=A0A4Z2EZV7_9TELE|nr:hypothetical protein EYF80_055446 [Liparis tanakae]